MVMEARHVDTPSLAAAQFWTRIDLDLYEIAWDGVVAGYVEVVGPVFVALEGQRYATAVEVHQALTFAAAVAALRPSGAAD